MISISPFRLASSTNQAELELAVRRTEALMTRTITALPDCLAKLSPETTFLEGVRNPGSRKELCNLMTACLSEIIKTINDWQIRIFRVRDLHLKFFDQPWNSPNLNFDHTAALISPPDSGKNYLVDLTKCQFYSPDGLIKQGINNSYVPWREEKALLPAWFQEYGWVELNPHTLACYLFQTRDNFLLVRLAQLNQQPPYDILSLLQRINNTELGTVFENVNRPQFFRDFFKNTMPTGGLTYGAWLKAEAKNVVKTVN